MGGYFDIFSLGFIVLLVLLGGVIVLFLVNIE